MAESGRKIVTFDDFTGGDEGRARPVQSPAKTFRGVNCWNYPSGIGPRPPLQNMALTGLPNRKLKTFTYMPGPTLLIAGSFAWGFDNGTIYTIDAVFGAAAVLRGTMGTAPDDALFNGNDTTFCSRTGTGAVVTAAGVYTALPNLPAGRVLANRDYQMALASEAGPLRWSETNDSTLWPAANSVSIGAGGMPIVHLHAQRNQLVVWKRDGLIYTVSGFLGTSETIRAIDQAQVPHDLLDALGAVVNQSNLWVVGTNVMWGFSGAQAVPIPRPDIPARSGYNTLPWNNHPGHVVPLVDDDEFMVWGVLDKTSDTTKRGVWAQAFRPGKDQWSRHIFPVADISTTSERRALDSAAPIRVTTSRRDGVVYLCTTGDLAAAQPAKVYLFNGNQDQPHVTPLGSVDLAVNVNTANVSSATLADGDSGVPVVATFSTSEWWEPKGGQVAVKAVVVDYSFDPAFSPYATLNKFDISVEALQRDSGDGPAQSAVVTFTPPTTPATPQGATTRGQASFRFGDQGSGVGFRVRIEDWRGIVIHRITVVTDVQEARY